MANLYIGIDLGGTNIAAGIVKPDGTILHKKSIKTKLPRPESLLEQDIYKLCKELCRENGYSLEKDIVSVGIGTPGSVDGKRGIVWANVNFGYENWTLKDNLEKLFGIQVFIENDANTAVVAEVMAGSAKGCQNAVAVTIGTGVGGGAIVNGQLCVGNNYSAMEIGHTVIEVDGRLCNCGRKGCFERYASASALAADTRRAMRANPDSLMWEICPDIDNVDAKTAFDAMKKGDKAAKEVVDRYIKYLAAGLVNVINTFQPEILCIGGGVSNEKEFLIQLLRPYIEREDFARNARHTTRVIIAKFRNDAGIIGAAMLGVNNA